MKFRNLIIILFLFVTWAIVLSEFFDAGKRDDKGRKNINKEGLSEGHKSKKTIWSTGFEKVGIPLDHDTVKQKAWYYKSTSDTPQPLIVSLHTWSGDYMQEDTLALMARTANMNYIHPDFRGPNRTFDACCSDLAIKDIDAAIDYAIENGPVDTTKIYVTGTSGGGYATLVMFMRSRHNIRKFSAWVPISDLVAWYSESKIRGNRYARDILECTGTDSTRLDEDEAKKRSPLHMETPGSGRVGAELKIYCGVFDGLQGSVPITQSINFYNKLLSDLGATDSTVFVTAAEKVWLLERRRPLPGVSAAIGGRGVCLQKQYQNIQLTVFEGGHEMLEEWGFGELVSLTH